MVGFSIMDVNYQDGQSLIEFLLALPLLLGITMVLVRVNTAIQVSIVDQQYARAQVLFLQANSAFYPRLDLQQDQILKSQNQMIIGVSNQPASEDYLPEATVVSVVRSKNAQAQASDAPREEPRLRAKVRIRNSVTLCTPTYFLGSGQSGGEAVLPLGGDPIRPIGPSKLSEGTNFNNICGSKIPYE